jgi:hypothetical protein
VAPEESTIIVASKREDMETDGVRWSKISAISVSWGKVFRYRSAQSIARRVERNERKSNHEEDQEEDEREEEENEKENEKEEEENEQRREKRERKQSSSYSQPPCLL